MNWKEIRSVKGGKPREIKGRNGMSRKGRMIKEEVEKQTKRNWKEIR